MAVQLAENKQAYQKPVSPEQSQRERIKKEIRIRIYEALQASKELSPDTCLNEVRNRLSAVQQYCESVGKTFIFIEERISCNQYELGGLYTDDAILFRGPSEDASVAICVTAQGSLVHRNDSPWTIYKNVGDISPDSYQN